MLDYALKLSEALPSKLAIAGYGIAGYLVPVILFAAPNETGVIKLDSGPIIGRTDNGICEYLGIPFAAPPAGELRWRPPQAVTPWKNDFKKS